MNRSILMLATTALVAGPVAGCAEDVEGEGGSTVTVYAAASLTASFEVLAEVFEESHDGVEVQLNLAGSSDLAAQIENGAPADVFASADEATMGRLAAQGLTGSAPVLFATNTLRIVTPPGNPAGVESLTDLGEEGITLVVCAPAVPCGAASQAVAEAAGVELRPDSEEQSVTDVLGKVVSGEADAGLVYLTDVNSAGDRVQAIEFPEAESVVNSYPIAIVAGSQHPELAQAFLDLVVGEDGQQVLVDAGFGRP